MYQQPNCFTSISSERRSWGGAERTTSGGGGVQIEGYKSHVLTPGGGTRKIGPDSWSGSSC